MNKFLTGITALLLLTGITGCRLFHKSTRHKAIVPIGDSLRAMTVDTLKSGSSVSINDTVAVGKRLADSLTVDGILPLWNKSIAYNTFNGKAKVHYEGKDQQQDFAASIRMERGKKIWVSITALGLVEVARLQITPDTIILINRLKKEVTVLPFAEAGKLLPVSVDFAALQGLLIGDVLHPGVEKPGKMNVGAAGIAVLLLGNSYQQSALFSASDSTLLQQQLLAGGGNKTTLLLQYEAYNKQAVKAFANSRKINVQDSTGRNYIEMEFNKAEFDQPVDFNFSIPSKYSRK